MWFNQSGHGSQNFNYNLETSLKIPSYVPIQTYIHTNIHFIYLIHIRYLAWVHWNHTFDLLCPLRKHYDYNKQIEHVQVHNTNISEISVKEKKRWWAKKKKKKKIGCWTMCFVHAVSILWETLWEGVPWLQLHHCVSSYRSNCFKIKQNCSVWRYWKNMVRLLSTKILPIIPNKTQPRHITLAQRSQPPVVPQKNIPLWLKRVIVYPATISTTWDAITHHQQSRQPTNHSSTTTTVQRARWLRGSPRHAH